MNFTLTHEQQQLQDGARRFARERYSFERWRVMTQAGVACNAENWQQMADLGWLAITIAEEDGGLGGNATDVMVLMEEFGKAMVLEPYVSTCIAGTLLACHANASRRAQLLEGIATGACRIALAIGEEDSRFDLSYVTTRAEHSGDGFTLSGYKSYVPDGSSAHWLIVPARTSGQPGDEAGITLFLVASDAAGTRLQHYRGADYRQASALHLSDVRVDASAVIGEVGAGFALLDLAVDHAVVATLAEAVGAMTAASDMTLDYLKTRKQFGVTIGSFQALQHRMVDMTIACEEARSMLYYALEYLDGASDVRRRAVSAAKVRVAQSAIYVGQQAVQLHGGIGTSDELAISHFLKRLTMFELSFGNTDHHRRRFADTALAG
jgi:alkylation response protein AidB-like acyl-CoA dehydrogenase